MYPNQHLKPYWGFQVFVVLFLAITWSNFVHANSAALQWLTFQSQTEGSVVAPTDIVTSFQSTSEAL